MYYEYMIYGLKLQSEIKMEQFIVCEDKRQYDIEVRAGRVSDVIHELIDSGKSVGVKSDGVWFLNNHGIFNIEGGNKIVIEIAENATIEECKPFIGGLCMAFLFEQRGYAAIHSSAIAIESKAILISGKSGAGKTSLATAFLDNGAGLLADDIAMIYEQEEEFVTYPAFPQQKLCQDLIDRYAYNRDELTLADNRKDKYAISRKEQFCMETRGLAAIFILEAAPVLEVEIKEIQGTDKLKAILNITFTALMMECFGLPIDRMCTYISLAKKIPIYSIKRPEAMVTTDIQMSMIRKIISV